MSDGAKKRILIADDLEDNLEILKAGLEYHGFEAVLAKDGKEALELANRISPECVLLDVMMPHMSGFEVCRRLKDANKARNQFLPIILVTAKEDLNSKLQGLEQCLADDYIVKPFELKEVIAKVKVMLRIKQLQEGLLDAERMKVLLETAGAAAHELNQPLCALTCYVELLLRKTGPDDRFRRDIEGISECVDRLTEIVRRVSEVKRYMTKNYMEQSQIIDLEQFSL